MRFSLDKDGRFLADNDLMQGWFMLAHGYEPALHELKPLVREHWVTDATLCVTASSSRAEAAWPRRRCISRWWRRWSGRRDIGRCSTSDVATVSSALSVPRRPRTARGGRGPFGRRGAQWAGAACRHRPRGPHHPDSRGRRRHVRTSRGSRRGDCRDDLLRASRTGRPRSEREARRLLQTIHNLLPDASLLWWKRFVRIRKSCVPSRGRRSIPIFLPRHLRADTRSRSEWTRSLEIAGFKSVHEHYLSFARSAIYVAARNPEAVTAPVVAPAAAAVVRR